jgi:aminoglycoside N3'-acetyltransferase
VLGDAGTLAMPSMADNDDVPFDRASMPCRAVGLVADTFWRMPGVLRSDNPHAFAAFGPQAAYLTQPHPVDIPHGVDSPPGRVHQLYGSVLLLGVGHDCNTTHCCEKFALLDDSRDIVLAALGRLGRTQRSSCMRADSAANATWRTQVLRSGGFQL